MRGMKERRLGMRRVLMRTAAAAAFCFSLSAATCLFTKRKTGVVLCQAAVMCRWWRNRRWRGCFSLNGVKRTSRSSPQILSHQIYGNYIFPPSRMVVILCNKCQFLHTNTFSLEVNWSRDHVSCGKVRKVSLFCDMPLNKWIWKTASLMFFQRSGVLIASFYMMIFQFGAVWRLVELQLLTWLSMELHLKSSISKQLQRRSSNNTGTSTDRTNRCWLFWKNFCDCASLNKVNGHSGNVGTESWDKNWWRVLWSYIRLLSSDGPVFSLQTRDHQY